MGLTNPTVKRDTMYDVACNDDVNDWLERVRIICQSGNDVFLNIWCLYVLGLENKDLMTAFTSYFVIKKMEINTVISTVIWD